MTKFKLTWDYEVVCRAESTENGFKHIATLLKNGREVEIAKICYINRTWESFEYESVIVKLLDKAEFGERLKKSYLDKISGKAKQEINDQFNTISTIAKLGEVFGTTKKEKNDWKTRMIKAGLENKGLIMPDDWDDLSEENKEIRLNGVIKHLATT